MVTAMLLTQVLVAQVQAPDVRSADALDAKIQADEPKSAAEFQALVAQVPSASGLIDDARSRYELSLIAFVMGDAAAKQSLPSRWDDLMNGTSRPRRFTSLDKNNRYATPEKLRTVPAPRGLQQVWMSDAKTAPGIDSKIIAQLFKDDQDARAGDWSKMTPKQIQAMVEGDEKRMRQIRALLKNNQIKTGNDYWKAAFLFQHGSTFGDYATAHELSVAAIRLGSANGKWIAGASYDRMMLAGGYPQRFGTQFRSVGEKVTFSPIDKRWMNDRMRRAIIGKSLDEAMKVFGG